MKRDCCLMKGYLPVTSAQERVRQDAISRVHAWPRVNRQSWWTVLYHGIGWLGMRDSVAEVDSEDPDDAIKTCVGSPKEICMIYFIFHEFLTELPPIIQNLNSYQKRASYDKLLWLKTKLLWQTPKPQVINNNKSLIQMSKPKYCRCLQKMEKAIVRSEIYGLQDEQHFQLLDHGIVEHWLPQTLLIESAYELVTFLPNSDDDTGVDYAVYDEIELHFMTSTCKSTINS